MAVTITQIKQLREKTNAGMMDCKKALVATEGDVKEAVVWLRKKGIAKAAKKADRATSEGVTKAFIVRNKAILFVLSCETDFVARNEEFTKLTATVQDYLTEDTSEDVAKALQITKKGVSLKNVLENAIATLGENIVLQKIIILRKNDKQCFVVYNHANDQISSVCLYDKEIDYSEGKKIAMQIAAMQPKYISPGEIEIEVINNEKDIIISQMEADEKLKDKPEIVLEKILKGRLAKNVAEMCLTSQELIMDTKYKVSEWLDKHDVKILKMARVAVNN